MDKTEELKSLYDGKVTVDNMFWYIHTDLLPKLNRMRQEDKI